MSAPWPNGLQRAFIILYLTIKTLAWRMSSLCNDVFALVRSSLFKCQRFYCWKCDKSIYLISWFLTVIDNYDGVQWDIGFLTKKICKLCQYNERLMLLLIMMTGHTILTSTQHTRLCCYLSVRPMKMPNGAISPKQFKKFLYTAVLETRPLKETVKTKYTFGSLKSLLWPDKSDRNFIASLKEIT